MVYLALDKEFVDKNLKKWNEEAVSELGEDEGKGIYLIMDDINLEIEEIDESEGNILVKLDHPKLGYLSFNVNLTADDFLDLIDMAIKKLNKLKTVLEGLK